MGYCANKEYAIEFVKFLIKEGASLLPPKNKNLINPLFQAIWLDNFEIARFLMQKGMDLYHREARVVSILIINLIDGI